MWLLIDISADVYINMVSKNEYTAKDVIAVHNALMGAVIIDDCRERKCNQCTFYEGVHNVQGHAPCSKKGIPGVLWNDRCDQFQMVKEGIDRHPKS